MNIGALFSTEQRIKILREVVYQTEPINVSRTARKLGLSKGLVSKYLKILHKERVLHLQNGDIIVDDSVTTKAVRILLNLSVFHDDFFSNHPTIKGAGLYGSAAKGTNIEGSDTDIWILTEDVSQETLAKLTSEMVKTFGDIRPLYLTAEKLEHLREAEATFYHSLVFGSITLFGDSVESLQP